MSSEVLATPPGDDPFEQARDQERELIELEERAERRLSKAQRRLDKANKKLERAEKRVESRMRRLRESRSELVAAQKARARGPQIAEVESLQSEDRATVSSSGPAVEKSR